MKTTFNRLGAALVAAAFCTAPSFAFADGKQVFLDQKCAKCHEVKSQGIAAEKKPTTRSRTAQWPTGS
jgi:mono/diheme cytochrome c family protein